MCSIFVNKFKVVKDLMLYMFNFMFFNLASILMKVFQITDNWIISLLPCSKYWKYKHPDMV